MIKIRKEIKTFTRSNYLKRNAPNLPSERVSSCIFFSLAVPLVVKKLIMQVVLLLFGAFLQYLFLFTLEYNEGE